jgi:hypothetical protein
LLGLHEQGLLVAREQRSQRGAAVGGGAKMCEVKNDRRSRVKNKHIA